MNAALSARVEELRADRVHGAGWMAQRAVETLVQEAAAPADTSDELFARLLDAAARLAESRPGVGAVPGALGRVLAAANRERHLQPNELRQLVLEEARALMDGRRRAARSIAAQLAPRLEGAIVLTHSASETVAEALLHTPPAGVFCTISAPMEEGRTFAERLANEGLNVEVVEDDDVTDRLSGVTLVLLGADTVFRDGTLSNKVGTHPLAQAAKAIEVPVEVACEVIKLAPFDAPAPADFEPAAELFDLTPAALIDVIVTEDGSYDSGDVAALVDRTPFLREGYELLRRGA